jgi:hypothetical protein
MNAIISRTKVASIKAASRVANTRVVRVANTRVTSKTRLTSPARAASRVDKAASAKAAKTDSRWRNWFVLLTGSSGGNAGAFLLRGNYGIGSPL